MSKVTVELDYETVDSIVKQELYNMRDCLKQDLAKRKNGTGMAIFETDKRTDIALMKDHIDAFNTILSYYGEKND